MLQRSHKTDPHEGHEAFSEGPQAEAFAVDFLSLNQSLGQYCKQGATGVESL